MEHPEGIWELFDLSVDVGETTDVSANHPEVLVEMLDYWEEYERTNKVLPLQRPQF